MIGNLAVRVDKYDEALGTTNGRPVADCESAAKEFAKNLADLLWDPQEYQGHNIGGMGPHMAPICEIRLKNLVAQVRKVFPIATNTSGLKRYKWIPKFLSVRLNRHFRMTRYNGAQGENCFVCQCQCFSQLPTVYGVLEAFC